MRTDGLKRTTASQHTRGQSQASVGLRRKWSWVFNTPLRPVTLAPRGASWVFLRLGRVGG